MADIEPQEFLAEAEPEVEAVVEVEAPEIEDSPAVVDEPAIDSIVDELAIVDEPAVVDEPAAPVEKKLESSDEISPGNAVGDVVQGLHDTAESIEEIMPSSGVESSSSSHCSLVCGALKHPQVQELVHWRNPVHSAVTLCVAMSVLILLRSATTMSVISLWLLCMLMVAVTFRVTIATILTFQKKQLKNPLERYLDGGLPVDEDVLMAALSRLMSISLRALEHVRSCLLIEDTRKSFMFFLQVLSIYQLTSMISPLTIKTIAVLLLFAIPPFYEKNKAQVDPVLKDFSIKVKGVVGQVRALPVIGQLFPKEKTA